MINPATTAKIKPMHIALISAGGVILLIGCYLGYDYFIKKGEDNLTKAKRKAASGSTEKSETLVSIKKPDGSTTKAPTAPRNYCSAASSYPLQKGSRNADVCFLQSFLNTKYNSGLKVDGDWGSGTEKAMNKHIMQNEIKTKANLTAIIGGSPSIIANPFYLDTPIANTSTTPTGSYIGKMAFAKSNSTKLYSNFDISKASVASTKNKGELIMNVSEVKGNMLGGTADLGYFKGDQKVWVKNTDVALAS